MAMSAHRSGATAPDLSPADTGSCAEHSPVGDRVMKLSKAPAAPKTEVADENGYGDEPTQRRRVLAWIDHAPEVVVDEAARVCALASKGT